MRKTLLAFLTAATLITLFALSTPSASARSAWSVGFNFGGPGWWGGPAYPAYAPPAAYYYGPAYPVCYRPAPVPVPYRPVYYGAPWGVSFGYRGH